MKPNNTEIRAEDRDQPRMAWMKRDFCTEVPEPIRTTEHGADGLIIPVIPVIRGFKFQFLSFDSVQRRGHGPETRQKDGGKNISAANTFGIHSFFCEHRKSAALPLCVLLGQFSALADMHYVDMNSTNATPPYTNRVTRKKIKNHFGFRRSAAAYG